MSENTLFNDCENTGYEDAVCVHTDKIYDQCRDKDCIADMRVYLTQEGQALVNDAINVKLRKVEIIWIYSDIEAVPFHRGYYSVDLKYFFKVTLDVYTGVGKPCKAVGLATFDKKVILFGSEGSAKVFGSKYSGNSFDAQSWQKTNMPKAVIEVVDPIALSAKLVEPSDGCCSCCDSIDLSAIPSDVCGVFDSSLVFGGADKRVLITIGVFSIIRLERSVQLLMPAYDFCVPDKDCVAATEDNPCELFDRIEFPVDEFFPPVNMECDEPHGGCCGCGEHE
ncbi:MAG: hypothetical protein IJD83_06725 [Clostridia bacterium]|nr:hypothetical protein [Clostridia bacterium]